MNILKRIFKRVNIIVCRFYKQLILLYRSITLFIGGSSGCSIDDIDPEVLQKRNEGDDDYMKW